MENRSRLFTIVLGLLCAISIISALFMFGQVRKVETEYVDKEAEFIRENMDMNAIMNRYNQTDEKSKKHDIDSYVSCMVHCEPYIYIYI